jgi:prephenate dehydrogenase
MRFGVLHSIPLWSIVDQDLNGFKLRKLAVFGVGLIGGSFAAALKQAGAVTRVVGVGRGRANLERALELGVIDEIAGDASAAVRDADFVLLAAPVRQTGPLLEQIASDLAPDCVVTDAGSTKLDVVDAARRFLEAKLDQFVPAHPIAGAERSGVEAANASLFRGRLVVLTPLAETAAAACSRVEAAWRLCGARLVQMEPARHDRVFAAVSHLPHALAFALVHMMAARPDADELLSFAGAGFRDFTRIAGSSPEMWRDICLANREALLREIEAFQSELAGLAHSIRDGDAPGVERLFDTAREARSRWLQRS